MKNLFYKIKLFTLYASDIWMFIYNLSSDIVIEQIKLYEAQEAEIDNQMKYNK